MRGRADITTAVAAIVGSVPGLALPFVLATNLGGQRSDTFLLALSIAVTMNSILGAAIEVNALAVFGRLLGEGVVPSARSVAGFRLKSVGYGVAVSAVAAPLYIWFYSGQVDDPRFFAAVAAVIALGPIVGSYSGATSGQTVAMGRTAVAVLMQSFKSVIPLVLAATVPTITVIVLAAGFVVGEAVRGVVLSIVNARAVDGLHAVRTTRTIAPDRIVWQSGSNVLAQGQPVTDRYILGGAAAGSITAYELADRVLQAASQLVVMGLLIRRLSNWSRLRSMSRDDAARMFRRDIRILGLGSILASVGIVGVCVVGINFAPSEWRLGLSWAAALAVSLPPLVLGAASTRLLVIAQRQKLLIWFSLASVVATVILDIVLFGALGPFGVIVAAVCVRSLMAVAYLLALRRVLPPLIGSEVE